LIDWIQIPRPKRLAALGQAEEAYGVDSKIIYRKRGVEADPKMACMTSEFSMSDQHPAAGSNANACRNGWGNHVSGSSHGARRCQPQITQIT